MNPEDEKWLQEVRARLEKATPGTWEHCRGKLRPQFGTRINEVRSNGDSCAVVAWPGFDDSARDEKEHAANAKLIAHAPKDLRRLSTLVTEQAEEIERLQEGETWIAEQLMQMLVAIIPALGDAAIVTNKDLHADYVLSWVRQLAKEHIALRSEADRA